MVLLSTGCLFSYGLDRVFELAKKANFLGIEVLLSDIWDTRDPAYLKRLEKKYRLKIKAMHAAFGDLRGWDPKDNLKNSINLAQKINPDVLIIHPDFKKKELNNILKRENSKNFNIVFENSPKVCDKKTKKLIYNFSDPRGLADFDICFDTTHLATTNLDLLSVYPQIKDKIRHIHLSDSFLKPRKSDEVEGIDEDHAILGTGKLPLGEFLSILKKDSYKNHISIEYYPENLGIPDDKKILKNLIKSRQFIKKYFGE